MNLIIPECICTGGTPLRECPQSLPSVTSILDSYPKPWLAGWGKKVVAEAAVDYLPNLAQMLAVEGRAATLKYLKRLPDQLRDEAADRGTAVHKAAEEDAALEDVPEDARSRYEQYREWVAQQAIEVVAKERTVWDFEYGYAGTYDLAFRRSAFLWLGDIKTSGTVSESWRLQLAAYRYAQMQSEHVTPIDDNGPRYYHPTPDLVFEPIPAYDATGIVWLTESDFQLLKVNAGAREMRVFRALRDIHDWRNGPGRDKAEVA